ncbi:hypothetical protein ABPG77_010231 [Micractinium sp. CCAP 211/92]
MGQHPSKQDAEEQQIARLRELPDLIDQAKQRFRMLRSPAWAEKARGVPATPGSQQAQYKAAFDHWAQLLEEQQAIGRHWTSRHTGNPLPMPDRTPPFRPPTLPHQVEEPAALSCGSAGEVEPGTPAGGGNWKRGQHGGSSGGIGGGRDSAQAGQTERSESAPLLGGSSHGSSCGRDAAPPGDTGRLNPAPLSGGGGSQLAPGLRRRQGHARTEVL